MLIFYVLLYDLHNKINK